MKTQHMTGIAMTSNTIRTVLALAALAITGFGSTCAAEEKPLKVYILAGQSNMQRAYVKEYRAKLITAEEDAFWQRAASHQGYHYFGCAKTLAQIGKAFAEAMLEMEKKQ